MGCLFQKSLAYLAGNTIRNVDGVTVATPEPTPVYTPPSQQAATLNNMLGSPLAGILGGITYAAGGSTSTAYYVTTLGVATDGIAAGVAGLGGTSSVNVVSEGAPLPTSGLGVAAKGGVLALADTQAALTQQVADLRATLTSNARTSGNMGVAQIDIPGIQSTMAASSRIDAPSAAQQSLGFVGKVPETFQSSTVLTADNYALSRPLKNWRIVPGSARMQADEARG